MIPISEAATVNEQNKQSYVEEFRISETHTQSLFKVFQPHKVDKC